MKDDIVQIWTDGSSDKNDGTGCGGWATILLQGDQARILTGSKDRTTNNEMEAYAVLGGLKKLTRPCIVYVHTDSQYVQFGFRALAEGRIFDTHTAIWAGLMKEYQRHKAIRVYKERAHAGIKLNAICDALAYNAMVGQAPVDEYVALSEIRSSKRTFKRIS